jgi:hypothetical protein
MFARIARVVGLLLLLFVTAALAFLGGLMYHRFMVDDPSEQATTNSSNTSVSSVPLQTVESPEESYLRRRREVDREPAAAARRMSEEMSGQPLESNNPEFLYLYGRALLLSGRPQDAVQAFDKAVGKANADLTPENGQLKFEARLATAAAMLRTNAPDAATSANRVLDDVMRTPESTIPSAPSGMPSSSVTTAPPPQ